MAGTGTRRKKITKEDEEKIVELLKETDLLFKDIADRVGCADCTVGVINKRHGIRVLGQNRGKHLHVKQMPDDKTQAEIAQLFKEGHTLASIGQNVKLTPHIVKNVLDLKLPNWREIHVLQKAEAAKSLPDKPLVLKEKVKKNTEKNIYINGESPETNRCSFPVVLANGAKPLPPEVQKFLEKQDVEPPLPNEVHHYWCNEKRMDGQPYCTVHALRCYSGKIVKKSVDSLVRRR